MLFFSLLYLVFYFSLITFLIWLYVYLLRLPFTQQSLLWPCHYLSATASSALAANVWTPTCMVAISGGAWTVLDPETWMPSDSLAGSVISVQAETNTSILNTDRPRPRSDEDLSLVFQVERTLSLNRGCPTSWSWEQVLPLFSWNIFLISPSISAKAEIKSRSPFEF